jgi:hypothetical protein
VTADKRCPACRKGYKTEAGYQRHVSTHADDNGRPVCNTPPWVLCVGGWAAWVAVLWATGAFCENPPKANRQ